ncbi:hypothetical protein ABW21_db0201251 [Orbilia brochopaga]|nr:hypothetical protein ABW21_db0201251 [Drechslerella brochopaga]
MDASEQQAVLNFNQRGNLMRARVSSKEAEREHHGRIGWFLKLASWSSSKQLESATSEYVGWPVEGKYERCPPSCNPAHLRGEEHASCLRQPDRMHDAQFKNFMLFPGCVCKLLAGRMQRIHPILEKKGT